jgi:hypothetical protein
MISSPAFDAHADKRASFYADLSDRDLEKARNFQRQLVERCRTSPSAFMRRRLDVAIGIQDQIEAVAKARGK